MNKQDEKAFEAWLETQVSRNVMQKTSWLAACEYKDKQYNPYGDSPDWVQEAMLRTAKIETLKEQLAAKDAVIVKLRCSLDDCREWLQQDDPEQRRALNTANAALAIPNDVSALQEMLKQAKRETLRLAADKFHHSGSSIVEARQVAVALICMVEEIK